MQTWKNAHGITIFRLHYSADPDKSSDWAAKQRAAMTNEADYQQEFEINFAAKLGTLLYQLHPEATFEKSFPIPENWTRYWAVDPHPRVPHAFLWTAVDPWGDLWAYREMWPSRICGLPGKIPEDDNRFRIRQYVETLKWIESTDNPENHHLKQPEKIYKQIIDYAARGFKGTTDDDDQRNFQERYEQAASDLDYPLSFEDAIKHDEGTSIEMVNDWLKPRDVEQKDGTFRPQSKLHIFADKCPELVWELRNNRYPSLTPLMAERQDPESKPIPMRKHVSDDLKYICRANPEYVGPVRAPRSSWKPIAAGVNY